ncbi:hypothetical protein, unlikely [Trypanosoma brucei gambiense DAL972]|uniref:Uncharacterized protein n=1 Tax=Trypanosoma brucei gambiense (strain MHOM/CI/86/DAL972) TaxID=679716 RepID=C9ZK20_TRYB9|nr:hypothetical protein, unlikely [Trypanosoma brucei gambiense DAL972]CBH09784.1 hypothetical protein, unlikely [Trypanosoma brucei gambiense DAL972]|eukprot:XP_011772077.1 hypothetical protein, unlikely [Trypanosoma brucei gambiense DAL972]
MIAAENILEGPAHLVSKVEGTALSLLIVTVAILNFLPVSDLMVTGKVLSLSLLHWEVSKRGCPSCSRHRSGMREGGNKMWGEVSNFSQRACALFALVVHDAWKVKKSGTSRLGALLDHLRCGVCNTEI